MMGGRMWVESDGFSGSRFYFTVRMDVVRMSAEPMTDPRHAMPSGMERRQYPRILTRDLASVTVLEPIAAGPFEVRTHDLSKGGIKFGSFVPIDPGSSIHVRLPGESVNAEVRYCILLGSLYEIGAKFQD